MIAGESRSILCLKRGVKPVLVKHLFMGLTQLQERVILGGSFMLFTKMFGFDFFIIKLNLKGK